MRLLSPINHRNVLIYLQKRYIITFHRCLQLNYIPLAQPPTPPQYIWSDISQSYTHLLKILIDILKKMQTIIRNHDIHWMGNQTLSEACSYNE